MAEGDDLRPGWRDFSSEMADFRHDRVDFRPVMADFMPERANLKPQRADFRPDRTNIRPERATLMGGTNGQTLMDERTNKIPPLLYRSCSAGLHRLQAAAQ